MRAEPAKAPSPARGELYEGDCLELVPRLLEKTRARFDLVYVDPPFNAGGRRRARRNGGARASGDFAYDDAWGGIDAFIAMLEPRLGVMRDALAEHGSLWLHLDHRTVHEAKLTADRVFGRSAFNGEIIWVPGNGGRRRSGPSVTHQTILVYARGREMLYNADDPLLREDYASTSLSMHFNQLDAE